MKKFLALALALIMILSLAACGGVDKKAAVDAHTALAKACNEVGTLINSNASLIDSETVSAVKEIADVLNVYTDELESADLTQERADAIVEELADYADQIAELKTQVENEIAAGGAAEGDAEAEITPEQLQALTEAYNSVAPLYNELYTTAEANGWLEDEQTKSDISTIGVMLDAVGQALRGDLSALNGANLDELPEAVSGMSEGIGILMERVSGVDEA